MCIYAQKIKIDQDCERTDIMKKLKLKKWVKVAMAIISLAIIAIILTHFILNSLSNFNNNAMQCDQLKGNTCSYYEVQKYVKSGGYNG